MERSIDDELQVPLNISYSKLSDMGLGDKLFEENGNIIGLKMRLITEAKKR